MTMICGAVGRDGIVLAADQRRIDHFAKDDGGVDDTSSVCKIVDEPSCGIAYAWAGDQVADDVAREVVKGREDKRFRDNSVKVLLEESARKVAIRSVITNCPRVILFVFYGQFDFPQLWRLEIQCGGGLAQRMFGTKSIGGRGNPARFFERYYDDTLQIAQLKAMTATVVFCAGKLAPDGIEGLDMAVFDADGCHWIGQDEKDQLRSQWKNLDATIRKAVAG